MKRAFSILAVVALLLVGHAGAAPTRKISGVVVTARNEAVAGVEVVARGASGERKTTTDEDGAFQFLLPPESVALRVVGPYIAPNEKVLSANDAAENVLLAVGFVLPPVHESMVITAAPLDPAIDRRNGAIYRNSLFSRDDQIFHTLDAGINAGQHEGGGKSIEIRRFGFNLDHGGVSGGLKVLVDNVQQNQGTQAHGQGYLGSLKSLTPELVESVDILNGPFNAEYGDFSGLGVVHIRLRESLPDQFTLRLQGGRFDSFRAFLGYSPTLSKGDAFLAYEGSRTDGPFAGPLRYRRDNVSGNYTRPLRNTQAIGIKINLGRNDYFSSGQIPLDEVAAGRLSRFGFVDHNNGGRVRNATLAAYYRREWGGGAILKVDGFLFRSLFDLYSNFTFFLNDPVNGDEIQQHDSRLQEGANTQYLRPFKLWGQSALLIAGANFHDNQINVGLFSTSARKPLSAATLAHAHVTNTAGYVQQGFDFLRGRLHVDGGLRYDVFRFRVDDRLNALLSGAETAGRVQPKANVAWTPSAQVPVMLHFNYGRGIASQDARGVVQQPQSARISTTDFYQAGVSHHARHISLSMDAFLIDRSNEQVYIPDDGSIEFKGPSRAYGLEAKTSVQLTRRLAFNGGLTRVGNAFYRGTSPRVYVDSAPHFVSNAALTLTGWRGWSGSLRYRHISSYRFDGADPSIRAAGFDVVDFSATKQLRRGLEFNLSVDNLTNKRYFETQNFFASRLRPADPVVARIHATPGYPITATAGLTFRFGQK